MSLEIYFGPMYAGKTSKLIQMYKDNKNTDKVIIDYDISEISYGIVFSCMTSHINKTMNKVLKCKELDKLYNKDNYAIFTEDLLTYYYDLFTNSKYIYINEAQFFPDLKEFVLNMLSYGKNVYIYGLDADFKQEKFGYIWDLIPYATNVEKLTDKCEKCDNSSIISNRITKDTEQYLTDEKNYIPLCLNCKNNI